MGDSGGEGQAEALLSDGDEDRQAELEALRESDAAVQGELGEAREGLGEVVQEQVEGVAGDVGRDLRVAQLRESLEEAESYLASFEEVPGWDEVVGADLAALPMFDQALRRDWEQARGRVEALRAELAGMVDDEGEPAGEHVGESGEGLGEAVQEQVEGVAGDVGPDLRVAQLRESLEEAESYLASFEEVPGWDEVVGADLAALPMFDQALRRDWEQARGRVEALRAELAGMVDDEGEPAGEHVGESGEGLGEAVQEQVEGVAGDVGPDLRVAQLRESLEEAESHLASFEVLRGWDEIVGADLAALPMFDRGLREGWEEARGRVEGLRAELAGMVGDEGEPAGEHVGELGEHVGELGEGRAAGFVPAVIVTLAEVTGRMERHLRAMPPEFNPNRVRANVETAKQWVRQGQWTPAQLQTVESRLGAMQAAEMKLRNARRAKVSEVYVRAKHAIAQGRVPVTYFGDGVPGGVSSRPDVRLGVEVEFKLPGDNFGARVDSLGAELEREGLVDWRTAHGSKLVFKKDAAAIAAGGKWVLLKESKPFEVEATSPVLRNDRGDGVWPSMEKLLSAARRQGGYGSESGGHINVSFDWPLTPRQHVRVAQVAKVFEALLFRLGNVAGSDGSKQREGGYAGPIPLPSDPYTVDEGGGNADSYYPVHDPDDKYRAVRVEAFGAEGDRLEFRLWAGDAGELTRNPGLWQVRAELSAAIMLAGTDPAIYRELDRLMGDPDLLGYDDQSRNEGAWLEKLAEFLELLPLSESAQAQVVQLFAWTRPWKLTGDDAGHSALVVGLPEQSVLFPGPDVSKAQVVAEAYSYQLYKYASLVVARLAPDGNGILLRNGVIDFESFAGLLEKRMVGRGNDLWTLLAIPGAPAALLAEVLAVVEGPVLATVQEVYKTPDGRLLAGVYETDQTGRVHFRLSNGGWMELTDENPFGEFTGKADLGEALTDSRTRLYGEPAEAYRYWPARGTENPHVPEGAATSGTAPVGTAPAEGFAGGGLAGLAEASAGVPAGAAASGTAPVRPWSSLGAVPAEERAWHDAGLPQDAQAIGGSELGAGYRFLKGANQANYLSGDVRFQVNCQEAFVAFHNSLKFNRQFVAGPAGDDRDPARLVVALGREPRRVGGVAELERYVGSGPVGVAVPVIYQRADGSAHVIAAVHAGDRDRQGRVDLLDPQTGEPVAKADVSAVAGMWVIPVSGVGPDREVVLPPSGSGLRHLGWGAGLPTEVAGPKRGGGVSGPVAGEAGTKGTKGTKRTREAGESSSSGASMQWKAVATAAGVDSGNQGGEGDGTAPTDQAAQQDPGVTEQQKKKRKKQEKNAREHQAWKAEADLVARLQRERQSALEEGKQLDPEKAKQLAQLEPKVKQRKKKHSDVVRNSKRAKKAADADAFAKLKELEEQGQLTPEQQAELNLRREIKKDETLESRLERRASKLKNESAEIEVLEALPQSAEVEDRLGALRTVMPRWAGSAEQLKETRERLKKNRAALKSMQARGETGPGQIAGVEASGQQNEQDAMVLSEGSELAGADRDERDARSDGGVDLGASVDEVMADSGGKGQATASLSDLDEDRQTAWEKESREGLGEVEQEQVGGVAGDEGRDLRVAQLRERLEQAEFDLAWFEALPGWAEVSQADLATLPMADQGLRRDWEEARGRVEALRAELAGMLDDEGEPAGEHMGESREGRAAALVPPAIARLAELTGRMKRHLRTMPPEFNPNRVRANVETAKNMVRQGHWTSADLQKVESRLGAMEAAESALRNARRAKVREVYVQAKQAIGQGGVPITYHKDGVPDGVSSRSDVRLGFEVEFKLPGDDFDARVNSLGAALEQEGLVDWRTAHGSKLLDEKLKAEAIVANGRWALLVEGERFEVEATSPILRNDTERPVSEQVWPSMEKLLSVVQRQGGFGSESGGHINVSFDRQLTPVQYVRVAQVAKVFEALLYRLGNVAGGDGSRQRDVAHAAPVSLPSDPYTVDENGENADSYYPVPDAGDKHSAVRFEVFGAEEHRLEFRVWAGDAGELTKNPGLWQVRAELSAAMMLAGTDPAIYPELDRLMGDPDLLGYDDQTRDEGAWLEKLAEFLELLPLSEVAQAQVVQLFAWTRPWKLTGRVGDYPALIVGLPEQSVLFPAPGASKAQVLAEAYSYQLYKDASLVVARLGPNGDGILLRNGDEIDFQGFAQWLEFRRVDPALARGLSLRDLWTLLAIPGAPAGLLAEVCELMKGPVLATVQHLYKTDDGRLLTGVYETDQTGHVQFRPSNGGWMEFTEENPLGELTGKADLGEALMVSRTRRWPDKPAEVYPYWPARGSGS